MEKTPDNAAAAAPAAAGGEKNDFNDAFGEFAKAKTEAGSAPLSEPAAAASAAAAEPAPGAAKPAADKPDAAQPAQPAAAAKPADGAASAAAATVDPWKDAPQALREAHERELEEARKAREAAEQKAKSAEGRYKAANSKAVDLERKLSSAPASAAPAAAAPAAAPAAAQPAPAAGGEPAADSKGPQMPPEWSQLVETLPDVAKAVEARFGAVDKAVRDALAAVKPTQEAEDRRFAREQGTLLDEAYPGWGAAVKTPEFATWIKQQPQSVRELAKSNYAADNAALLEYYGYQPPQEKPQPAGAPDAGGKSAAQIAADRDARLARNTSVRGSGAAPLADAPDNFEQAFTFYARRRQEASARRV